MKAQRQNGSIMVFARAPVPGRCKTRLIPALGREGAANLHASLVEQTLSSVNAVSNVTITLSCSPSTEHVFFQSCAQRYGVVLAAQSGQDLGARMQHAFETTLQSAPWAIILGTDCPDLESSDVQQAVEAMRKGADAVAGPAYDGGYYLLGLRQSSPELFQEMPWGTESVWEITRHRLEQLGWTTATTTWRYDLDRPEDLDHFPHLQDDFPVSTEP